MSKDKYHHGDLKQEIIHNGLILLNEEGFEKFSLRKVASMCGVSHAAPYKHFKDKEELIQAIVGEVWERFYLTLSEITILYSNNFKTQIIEMGKAYVKFMIDNPEYLKFMFLSDNSSSIKIEDDKFYGMKDNAFKVFKDCAENYLKTLNLDENQYMEKTLAMWSLVHGSALLIAKRNIEYNGDYLELVERMIVNGLGI